VIRLLEMALYQDQKARREQAFRGAVADPVPRRMLKVIRVLLAGHPGAIRVHQVVKIQACCQGSARNRTGVRLVLACRRAQQVSKAGLAEVHQVCLVSLNQEVLPVLGQRLVRRVRACRVELEDHRDAEVWAHRLLPRRRPHPRRPRPVHQKDDRAAARLVCHPAVAIRQDVRPRWGRHRPRLRRLHPCLLVSMAHQDAAELPGHPLTGLRACRVELEDHRDVGLRQGHPRPRLRPPHPSAWMARRAFRGVVGQQGRPSMRQDLLGIHRVERAASLADPAVSLPLLRCLVLSLHQVAEVRRMCLKVQLHPQRRMAIPQVRRVRSRREHRAMRLEVHRPDPARLQSMGDRTWAQVLMKNPLEREQELRTEWLSQVPKQWLLQSMLILPPLQVQVQRPQARQQEQL
jgi:hypothetical protein